MKRFLLWSFERGSVQYDVICIVILAFIFLTPQSVFHDQPKVQVVPADQAITQRADDDGHTIFTVKIETAASEQAAIDRLKAWLGRPFTVAHTEPVYDTTGALVAYSIWIER